MALLYVNEFEASQNWGEVATGEEITEGDLIVSLGDGTFRRADASQTEVPDGIVVHDAEGDSIAEHDEDYFANYDDLWTYQEGDNFYWVPISDVDVIMPRSITDTTDGNGNTPPEPTFGEENVVGYITDPNGQTRIVPEGYSYDFDDDGTAETYSESGDGDFVSIGRVDKYPQELRIQSHYDQRIPVRLAAQYLTSTA